MNIDERLEKLAERHEALAGTVELLTADIRDFVAASAKRDEEYDKLRQRMLRGALGLMGIDESEGTEPPA